MLSLRVLCRVSAGSNAGFPEELDPASLTHRPPLTIGEFLTRRQGAEAVDKALAQQGVKWPQWDRARLRTKFRVVHTKAGEPPRYRWHLGCILLKMPAISLRAGTEKMNRLNKMIDRSGVDSLRDNQEARDEILRNSLIWWDAHASSI